MILLDPEDEHLRPILFLVGEGVPAISINGKPVKLSRILTLCPADKWVDHKNNNPLDNRKENLRICTAQQNNANRTKAKGKSSAYKGVSWRENRKHWRANIMVDGISFELGTYKEETGAAKAYNKAARFWFGEFAKLNEVE